MSEAKLLTVRDVASVLGITEKEVVELVESNRLEAYKVGGVYLRFKREQVQEFRKSFKPPSNETVISQRYSFKDKIRDFFYFNDFYILSALIIFLIIVIISQG